MKQEENILSSLTAQDYKWGFVTDIESDSLAPGLSEEVIRHISEKKREPEFMLEWRLRAYHRWLEMEEPRWAFINYPEINYQDIVYYSAPKNYPRYQSLDEVDPELLKTYERLGLSVNESSIMIPRKSVTAFIGMKREKCRKENNKCKSCKYSDCVFRKEVDNNGKII